MVELRMARMIPGVIIVALVLYDLLYVRGASLMFLIVVLRFVWLAPTLFQLYGLSRVRGMIRGTRELAGVNREGLQMQTIGH